MSASPLGQEVNRLLETSDRHVQLRASEVIPFKGSSLRFCVIWGFPKIRGTILGFPIIRTIVFWGLYWGPINLGNCHICVPSKALA